MRMFDTCSMLLDKLLRERRLFIKSHIRGLRAQDYFACGLPLHTGITVSTVEGEAGLITRVWGVVFIEPTRPQCCTDIHSSYFGEAQALNRLHEELLRC